MLNGVVVAAKKRRATSGPRSSASLYGIGRDVVLFVCGLAGVLHETIASTTERPTLLLMFAAMMGLPAFLRSDEARKRFTQQQEAADDEESTEDEQ